MADFNSDGHLDLLWKNGTTGVAWVWFYDGTQVMSASYLFTSDPDWKVVVLTDLDADGKTDVVLRDRVSGDVYAWYFNGITFVSQAFLFNLDPALDILGAADFNGDGERDVVFYDPATQLGWVTYGPGFPNVELLFGVGDPLYQPVRIADYNGDGRPDVVVRGTVSGISIVWYFADRAYLGGAGLYYADPEWQHSPVAEAYQKSTRDGPVRALPPGFVAPNPRVVSAAEAAAARPEVRRTPRGQAPITPAERVGPTPPGPPLPAGGKRRAKSFVGSSGFAIFHIHADHLNTPRLITRPSDLKAVWRWDNIDPFGANAPNENPSGAGVFMFNLRFPGQYYDAETGKHYNYYRDYDPAIGRYIQSDPIGLGGGLNTYGYVAARPLSAIDPLGLVSCTGKWVRQGWNPNLPRGLHLCTCYFLCMPCEGSVAWSGIKENLPSTSGRMVYVTGGSSKDGDPEYGNQCLCNGKPGPETGCKPCK